MRFAPIFRKAIKSIVLIFLLGFPGFLLAQPLFIYRPRAERLPLSEQGKIHLRGELFAHLLLPSNYPSFNDLSGEEDRWNLGFQNIIDLTPTTSFLAQLVTHDDGQKRTKFDWHFSLRQHLGRYIVLLIGHDSNHDSDHESQLQGRLFYLNRNYLGFSLHFESDRVLFEPFTWFFHHTNQRSHLDFSGEKLRQEYGFRLGVALSPEATLSLQTIFQSDTLFARGQSHITDLILRLKLRPWVELSLGGGFWRDLSWSRLGNRQSFYKIIWGIALPF